MRDREKTCIKNILIYATVLKMKQRRRRYEARNLIMFPYVVYTEDIKLIKLIQKPYAILRRLQEW
jgi:hypothetical protein